MRGMIAGLVVLGGCCTQQNIVCTTAITLTGPELQPGLHELYVEIDRAIGNSCAFDPADFDPADCPIAEIGNDEIRVFADEAFETVGVQLTRDGATLLDVEDDVERKKARLRINQCHAECLTEPVELTWREP